MPFSYVQFMRELMAPRPYPEQPNFDPPGLTPLRKPIAESTIGVFTSAGVQLRGDKPMTETNDLTYPLIDRETPLTDLILSHMTPVRVWASEDLNVAYPRDRLIELETDGAIRRLAPKAVSMVGSISKFSGLIEDVVPMIKREFDEQGVDLVFLFPF